MVKTAVIRMNYTGCFWYWWFLYAKLNAYEEQIKYFYKNVVEKRNDAIKKDTCSITRCRKMNRKCVRDAAIAIPKRIIKRFESLWVQIEAEESKKITKNESAEDDEPG